jgi:hypothetical protein
LSFWWLVLRAVPIVVAAASTAALAYFLLSERSQPFAQLQQEPRQQESEQQSAPSAPQSKSQPQVQQAQAQPQQQAPAAPMRPPPMPNDDKLLMLINSSLIALNQANMTGNYTVLRDMAAPGFQQANSAERLAKAFSNLRSRNLDLSPVLLFQPKLYRRPVINDKGMLRITGFFPTSPERVNFDLIFQPVQGRWRLYGIAANTQRVPPPQAAPAPETAPAPEAANPAKPAAAEVTKPAAPAKKPAAKPKPAAETEETVVSPQVDVRDRIDSPPPAPPAEKPKPKNSIWNPFGR